MDLFLVSGKPHLFDVTWVFQKQRFRFGICPQAVVAITVES